MWALPSRLPSAWSRSAGSASSSPFGTPGRPARPVSEPTSSPRRGRSRPKPSVTWTALAALALLSSIACAGSIAAIRPRRPPLPNDRALDELFLLCQPDADKCRPTRVEVEVCATETDEGCTMRDGFYGLAQELDVYDDYVRELRGEEVPE